MEIKPTLASIIALITLISFPAIAAAVEDGTGGSLPDSFHQCDIVVASWNETTASPEASPIASPVASPVVETDPLTTDLEAATHAILDCMSDNNLELLLELTDEPFRGSWLGLDMSISDDDFSVLLPMMPNLPYALVEIEETSVDGDTATAIVKYTTGRQLITSEWTYQLISIDGQNVWQVQQQSSLPTEAPENASVMELTVDDGSFTFDSASAEAGDIVINVENVGDLPHEVLIVRAPGGTEAADFAAATSGIPDGATFIGQVTIPAGTEGSIVLTDVRAGTYTVVDLLPDATGMPNVSNGMIEEFTVEQP